MEEYLDILTEEGNFTGVKKERNEVHKEGEWHGSSKIWLLSEKGEVLIQH
ncbi:MAG: hypothetical protein HPY66_3605 [Firmicutes bacterium]|nr:hypothetical protein [Bacillota bacterium]